MTIKTNDHQIQKVHMKQTAYVKTRSNNEEVQVGLIAFTRQHADIVKEMRVETKTSDYSEALYVTD
ncbi:hypothetical protein PUN50_22580 [Vibrio campbellii]|uniref:Uncharacterized protein n=1 Tax=Vibrio campbellii TaxID=680 RepID=A0AAQ2Y2S6_9VIBR|nr:hypothetical protein [Vibrio campbellii]WDG10165.1 hypothetical protein PUN50_22580 [Vibrio campbellii]